MATPGDHEMKRGIEVVAIEFDGINCNACHFDAWKNKGRSCADVGCHDVIWLTPLNYIAHRLTQGTTP